MTAQFDSQDPRDFNQQTSAEDENYVPEREFVLMPYFRRIGQRLGFRRSSAPESIYSQQLQEKPSQLIAAEEALLPPVSPIEQLPPEPELIASVPTYDSANTSPASAVDPAQAAQEGVVVSFDRKEDESLRKAKTPDLSATPDPGDDLSQLPPTKPILLPKIESSAPAEKPQPAAATPAHEAPREPDAQLTVPALQRELAWQEHSSGPHPFALAAEQKTLSPDAAPPPVATWWQHRIDWSRYLTAKRVALIGGLAMAALIILGVSLARRPAADMLPQQTAIQRVEPGGVTLSTHPVLPHAQQHSLTATSHTRQRRARVADDDGAEVVTHYYNQKPSPVHQATANGVHHYSDLN